MNRHHLRVIAGGAKPVEFRVPPALELRINEAVERTAIQLGTTPENCRRIVEQTIIQRGLEALEKELKHQ